MALCHEVALEKANCFLKVCIVSLFYFHAITCCHLILIEMSIYHSAATCNKIFEKMCVRPPEKTQDEKFPYISSSKGFHFSRIAFNQIPTGETANFGGVGSQIKPFHDGGFNVMISVPDFSVLLL
ncbi:unnamed protein product [Cylicocyclus nassatus]|uniref:Uncharacterized protein n=1 Tax=Cylicocyclus nassatus TaxID=53992 RepID=A0AA36H1M8_CYLNA|nr:unnamed protein product [Cylicocyclus nassatus]